MRGEAKVVMASQSYLNRSGTIGRTWRVCRVQLWLPVDDRKGRQVIGRVRLVRATKSYLTLTS